MIVRFGVNLLLICLILALTVSVGRSELTAKQHKSGTWARFWWVGLESTKAVCSFLCALQAEPTEAWKVPAAAAGLAGHGAELTAACQGVPGASPLSSVLNEPSLLGPEGLCPCNLCVPMSGPRGFPAAAQKNSLMGCFLPVLRYERGNSWMPQNTASES